MADSGTKRILLVTGDSTFAEAFRGIRSSVGLGDASLARGEEVPFVDHYHHTGHHARMHCRRIQAMADALGLKFDVRYDKTRVFVRSYDVANVSQKGE